MSYIAIGGWYDHGQGCDYSNKNYKPNVMKTFLMRFVPAWLLQLLELFGDN